MTILRRVLLGAFIVILGLATLLGILFFIKTRLPRHPITLTFTGWTNQGPARMARLVISNGTDYPLPFAADGRSQPRIDVMQVIARIPRDFGEVIIQSNLTSHLYVGFRPVSLPPGAAVGTAFPWQNEYTNALVSISYLPRRTFVGNFFRKIKLLLRNQAIESWQSAPLEAPWVTERQRRGSPRLGTNDNL